MQEIYSSGNTSLFGFKLTNSDSVWAIKTKWVMISLNERACVCVRVCVCLFDSSVCLNLCIYRYNLFLLTKQWSALMIVFTYDNVAFVQ